VCPGWDVQDRRKEETGFLFGLQCGRGYERERYPTVRSDELFRKGSWKLGKPKKEGRGRFQGEAAMYPALGKMGFRGKARLLLGSWLKKQRGLRMDGEERKGGGGRTWEVLLLGAFLPSSINVWSGERVKV